jgi:oligopeptide/dipeptide ABC transporter ATP-binding protein
MSNKLLEVNNLKVYFPIYGGFLKKKVADVKAVDDISFYVNSGETLGIVGESGCGKSTTGRAILKLINPTAGEAIFDNENLFTLSKEKLKEKRKDLQMIFQDPYASLNPRMTIQSIIEEGLIIHKLAKKSERKDIVLDLLNRVSLKEEHLKRYPHEFSGGQRQRIGIARALAVKPKLIICDEPVSALDVSVQAQVLNLMKDLQDEFKLTYVFIAHNLSVVEHFCDRIAVMYLGNLVEIASSEKINKSPKHPYTKALISAAPILNPEEKKERIILEGDVPNPIDKPSGCPFHPRCYKVKNDNEKLLKCQNEVPVLVKSKSDENHYIKCHFPLE